jgi:hypothetical protein
MEPDYPTGMSTRLLAKNGSAPAAPGGPGGSQQASLAEVGTKLANPVSDVWALFTQFGFTRSDGDLNQGDELSGGSITFLPILPIPLFGKDKDAWKIIVRPTVPLLLGTPVPAGFDDFGHKTGLGDTLLPLPISWPAGNWLMALGPTFNLPTSTVTAFGQQQWGVGPTGVLGYKTKDWIAVVFPQYHFGIGSRGDQGKKPDMSFLNMLYVFFYNLPEAWQVGSAPTLTYNNKAPGGGPLERPRRSAGRQDHEDLEPPSQVPVRD